MPPVLEQEQQSFDLEVTVREAEKLYTELRIRRCELDPLYWLTKCTKTQDEQDPQNPFKPFPSKIYLKYVLDYLNHCTSKKKWLPKSRTMMMSWECSAWAAHFGFTHPGMSVVFQSADEVRAMHDVKYVKTLWENSFPELKARWPLPKPVDQQPQAEFSLKNKTEFSAVTGNPDKIRSKHPTIVIFDEAAIWEEFETGMNVAVGSNPIHLIALSSVKPSYFWEVTRSSTPIQWPDYDHKEPEKLTELMKVWKRFGFPDYDLELAA